MNDFNDVWYQSQDGLRLYARDYRSNAAAPLHNEAGARSEIAIVCVPGLTRNSADFHELCLHVRDLSQSLQKQYPSAPTFRPIAVDLRGRGSSQYDSKPGNYTPFSYIDDVKTLIAHLQLQAVVFVGTSLGALVSMLISSTRPAYLRGLIMNDFGPELELAGLQRIAAYVGRSNPVKDWNEAVAQAREINGSELLDLSAEQWLDFSKNLYREENGRPVLAYDPAISEAFKGGISKTDNTPLWQAFESLPKVPLLLLRGALSSLLTTDGVQKMRQRRTDLVSVEVAKRGHAPLLNEPEALAAIDDLLTALVK